MRGWLVAGCGLLLAACGAAAPGGGGGRIEVVAAENSWGSLAAQLGGARVSVESVITDPNTDPHEYEGTAADARAFAAADLVILDGAGYDDWGRRLLDASPSQGRRVLDVASLLGKKPGDNPHFWYGPDFVATVADAITAGYRSVDEADASYFDGLRASLNVALASYEGEVQSLHRRFAGVPVGLTETVFAYMASAIGLVVTTPAQFMNAVAQGTDPPAGSVVAFQEQIASSGIRALVFNVQTATPVTNALRSLSAEHGIPTVAVSETLQPPGALFQDWQLAQLRSLDAALSARA